MHLQVEKQLRELAVRIRTVAADEAAFIFAKALRDRVIHSVTVITRADSDCEVQWGIDRDLHCLKLFVRQSGYGQTQSS